MSCRRSFTTVTSAAPNTAPGSAPTPPTTAISRYSIPALMPNGVGLTERCMCA